MITFTVNNQNIKGGLEMEKLYALAKIYNDAGSIIEVCMELDSFRELLESNYEILYMTTIGEVEFLEYHGFLDEGCEIDG